jgi:hypothetical protein
MSVDELNVRETAAGRLWQPEYDGQPSIAELASCLADCSDEFLPTRREALLSLVELRELRTTWIGDENAIRREIDATLDVRLYRNRDGAGGFSGE